MCDCIVNIGDVDDFGETVDLFARQAAGISRSIYILMLLKDCGSNVFGG